MSQLELLLLWPKATWGRKDLFHSYFHHQKQQRQGLKQGKNLEEEEADGEAMEGSCLLACSFWLAQIAFL